MTKMIFCRSKLNIANKPVTDGWAWYRPWVWATLIWAIVAGAILLGSVPSWADESNEDWPDAIYFPQRAEKPQDSSAHRAVQGGSTVGSTGPTNEKPEKKGIWPFRHDPKKQAEKEARNQKPPTDEQITQVGPKETPAYPDPLLRLLFPIHTDQGIIQPGFYLVRQLDKQASERTLALTRQHQVIFKFNVSGIQDISQGPIQPMDRAAPPKLSMEARLSDDQKTLTLILTEGAKRYESQAFSTAVDTRKILNY
jgi:hypothetical protein